MLVVLPADKDWVQEAAFRLEFTKALAEAIETEAERAIMSINPRAEPGNVQGVATTKVVGDGIIEIHRRDPAAELVHDPDLKIRAPAPPADPFQNLEQGEDPLGSAVNALVRERILEIVEQTKGRMKTRFPGSVGPATLGEFLRTK